MWENSPFWGSVVSISSDLVHCHTDQQEKLSKCIAYKHVLLWNILHVFKSQDSWFDKGVCATVAGVFVKYGLKIEIFLGARDNVGKCENTSCVVTLFMEPLILFSKDWLLGCESFMPTIAHVLVFQYSLVQHCWTDLNMHSRLLGKLIYTYVLGLVTRFF